MEEMAIARRKMKFWERMPNYLQVDVTRGCAELKKKKVEQVMKRLILELTDRQAQALKEMSEVYLVKGGPAWDCMQCWDEPFEASDLEALNDVIQKSIEAP